MKDANGTEIVVGARVRCLHLPDDCKGYNSFPGPKTVGSIAASTCVRVTPFGRGSSDVFLGVLLVVEQSP